ncbi:MAG: hypothetical protein JXB05_12260 [Myxococcaceae bacterium]|nr:hypothetical protein [Myxococcaceae bacterium]
MSDTDLGGMGYGPGGAHCAIHPDQPAARTCTRCGNFMCSTCSQEGTQSLCPSCQQRMGMGEGFPLTRDSWSFSALWDYCFEVFKRDWLMLSLGVLVFFGISMIVQFISQLLPAIGGALENAALTVVLTIASFLIQQVVQGVLALGLMRMIFDMLQGGKADVGRIFTQMHKVGTYLVTTLIIFLMVGIPAGVIAGIGFGVGAAISQDAMVVAFIILGVLSIFPLFYYLLPLYMVQAEIAYNDGVTPMQAIRNCYAYARGERLSILGVSLVGGLVVLVGALACCVGALPAMGLSYLLMGGLYLALRNGADVAS